MDNPLPIRDPGEPRLPGGLRSLGDPWVSHPDSDPHPALPPLRSYLLSDESHTLRTLSVLWRQSRLRDRWAPSSRSSDDDLDKIRTYVARLILNADTQQPAAIPLGWLGDDAPQELRVQAYRARAAGLMALAAELVGFTGDLERGVPALLGMAFGLDPQHQLLGDFLGGDPFPWDPSIPPPGGFGGLEDALRLGCVHGIGTALADLGRSAASRPRPWAAGKIRHVDPDHACFGDDVTIHGEGFGSAQPKNVEVFFTARDGGCVSATVVAWSDNEITVTVPINTGYGCVGLIEQPGAYDGLILAADTLAGALENCLGLAGMAAAQTIRDVGRRHSSLCPDCREPNARFGAGAPIIDFFDGDDQISPNVAPGGQITLSWSVLGAQTVVITAQGGRLPAVPGPLPFDRGQTQVGPLPMQDGEHAVYLLTATNACGMVTARLELVCRGKTAIAFSGGGSKGAFEAGAVRCLYDVVGVRPSILSGASVGALNAAKLAEGPAALAALEALWLGLQTSDDFYLKPGWFHTFEPLAQALLRSDRCGLWGCLASTLSSFAVNQTLGSFVSALGVPGALYSVLTSLYPAVTLAVDVAHLVSAATQAMSANSIFLNTPLLNLILAHIDPAKVAASGIQLRVAMVSLETGRTEVVNETGHLLSTGHALPLTSVLLASASLPVALPPVAISGTSRGTEHFVDGGVRNNVPIREAVQAGADRVYALLLNPVAIEPAGGFGQAKLAQLAPRALNIMMDEMQTEDVAPFLGFGVPVELAAPTFLVHDTLDVDPGLISINMDYGFLRAYDSFAAPAAERSRIRQNTDDIILARLEAWTQEHYANGERLHPAVKGSPLVQVPDPVALQNVRDLKALVRSLTKDRIAAFGQASVPAATLSWWQAFERHSWQPFIPDPWSSMSSRLGNLAAAPMPGP